MSGKYRVIPIKDVEAVTRRVWRVVPYDEIVRELKVRRTVFVEGIKRQTAFYAAKKLSKMLGEKVVQRSALVKLRGEFLEGYSFELASETS
jgi:hypothetical protein